jgi:hypothetical protein
VKIELECSECGGNRFNYPVDFRDTSVIVCADCGHEIGTVADLEQQVLAQLSGQKAA